MQRRSMFFLLLAWIACPATIVWGGAIQVGPDYFGTGSRLVNFDTTPDGAAIGNDEHLGALYSGWGVTFGGDAVTPIS